MKLIDADLLKKNCKCTGKFKDNFKCVSLTELARVIDNQPIAASETIQGGLNMIKITKCKGEGQSSCKRCNDKGVWNRHWACFLYKIEGQEGCYCEKCIKEIMRKEEED